MPVGEVFLSAFLQVLFDRLAPRDWSFFPRLDLVPELQKLNRKLLKIEAVLADAEEKQLSGDKLVKMWLDDLQDLAYDLDDLLDEFATQELERKLNPAEPQSTSILEDAGSWFVTSCTAKFDDMKSRIDDISGRLDRLWEDKEDLGLIKKIAGGTSSTVPAYPRPPTSSLPTETTVFGRDGDAAKILDMVLSTGESDGDNFRVISIVGMGGIGKTTLAQKVFNDEAVKDFNPKAWTCVSENFDVLSISKAILRSITRSPCILTELDAVQKELQEAVAGKKFLLVLDDVWSQDYRSWEILRSPFKAGAGGSKIIVTTRDKDVAFTMGAPNECHRLKILSDDECWSLFKAHAFECREIASHGDIELIRQKVIEKCKGLPLAAKTLAGLLRSKQEREDEWLEMLNSKMWDLLEESDDIPATLKLSYYYLPSHLKRCFAHCAIFLEDYEFLEEELIHLWMAEGLIPAKENQQLEDLGHEYFIALVSRSFFQQSNINESKHTMHDLVHDLAKWAFGVTCYHLEDMTEANKPLRSFDKVRHLSFARGDADGKCKFGVLNELEQVDQRLRTFLPLNINQVYRSSYIAQTVIIDLLPKFRKLRMLSLEGYYVTELPESFGNLRQLRFLNMSGTRIESLPESTSSLFHLQILKLEGCSRLKKLPESFGNLKQLRFLNMSRTMIENLPESTSSLLNLQILKLRGCSRLKKLPSKIRNLINLRYLDINEVYLHEMPLGMNELKCLQYLSNFIVGKGFGIGLKNLKLLKSLCGEHCISRLENVDLHETREMILNDKQKLKVLQLEWNSQFDDTRNEVEAKEVLGLLRPHPNLEKLKIKFYGGLEFPSWVGDSSFSKMTSLTLDSCEKCRLLPSLGMLGSLKDLTIRGMKGLKSIGKEICGQRCSTPFQSLQILCFQDMQEWEHWEPIKDGEYGSAFPCLREFSVENCPKLSGRLPDCLPSLEKLVIKNCKQLEVSFSSLPMLSKLEIDGCKELACNSSMDSKSLKSVTIADISEFGNWLRSPQGLQSFISITELRIENFSNLISFPEVCFLINLSTLEIINCNALTSLPKGMNDKNSCLGSLKMKYCNCLTFIVRGKLPSSLKTLEIEGCEKLEYLWDDNEESCTSVEDEENSNTTRSLLEYMHVGHCPSLKCILSSGHLPQMLRILSLHSLPKLESIAESFLNNKSLEEIIVSHCRNLKGVPKGLHNLNHLRKIVISDCENIDCLGEEGPPNTNLCELTIEFCHKLKALPNWFRSFNSLQSLSVYECPSFLDECFPTNLTSLQIDGKDKMYKAVLEWGLHNLTSLKSLWIWGLPEAESFPQQEMEMTFPPSLTHLNIYNFPNLKCLMGEGFRNLNSLEALRIDNCPNLTSFIELSLPSSLQSLYIEDCQNLESFSKLGLPSSLSYLMIWNCREVRSFPEQGLPSSLLRLHIVDCPKLKTECKRDKGKEWSKISHIPRVEIDGRYIYDLEEEEFHNTIDWSKPLFHY
ncbi:hypothetical protein Ddye_027863 [Dipteronia dyeriana]|uniref:Disease resistance RPP13-like protein 1 n=1 Tax=Dipteronia dyeriana TaxID=168575 RepID=A0AAD9WRU9_9ROSI|nr:hypothetical protein Ddye_027863 [Dipteronia dyeriana]